MHFCFHKLCEKKSFIHFSKSLYRKHYMILISDFCTKIVSQFPLVVKLFRHGRSFITFMLFILKQTLVIFTDPGIVKIVPLTHQETHQPSLQLKFSFCSKISWLELRPDFIQYISLVLLLHSLISRPSRVAFFKNM